MRRDEGDVRAPSSILVWGSVRNSTNATAHGPTREKWKQKASEKENDFATCARSCGAGVLSWAACRGEQARARRGPEAPTGGLLAEAMQSTLTVYRDVLPKWCRTLCQSGCTIGTRADRKVVWCDPTFCPLANHNRFGRL